MKVMTWIPTASAHCGPWKTLADQGARHSVPLVDGMPEPSIRTASRSERATALNVASMMWWVFLPRTSVMCSVMRASVTKARQNSSTSCGSNGGSPRIFSPGNVDLVDEERPARQVEGHVDQRLVERHPVGGEAAHAGLVAERGAEHLAQGDADVLDGVVGVDLEVAVGPDGQVEAAVAAELAQHVVEERQPGATPRPGRCRRAAGRWRCRSRWWCGPTAAARGAGSVEVLGRSCEDLREGVEEGVVLVGRADGDPQAALESGHRREVAHQDRPVEQRLPELVPAGTGASGSGRNSTKLAPRRPAARPAARPAGRPAGRAPRPGGRPARSSRRRSRGRACRPAAWPRRGGRAARPSRARPRSRPGRSGSRGGPRPSTRSWRTCG